MHPLAIVSQGHTNKSDYSFSVGHPGPRREAVMKPIHSLIAALGLAFILAAPSGALLIDPEVIIYRFPGVRDDGGGSTLGVATSFHCTNFGGSSETIRFVTRSSDGTLKSNIDGQIAHLGTLTATTHATTAYFDTVLLNTGQVTQGTTAIAATSINVICTAMTIDATTAAPVGVALRGIRFSPVPGSQE